MKKITCIQNYVIDNLIEDEILSTNSLLSAVSKVCSEEQFNNILAILIETPIPCTKEDSGNKTNLVGDDPTGSIVIWEHPNKDASAGLYIAGIDSYDY